ncbi:hypothetical protein LDENG_00197090, partial [Lucifuga dentata]
SKINAIGETPTLCHLVLGLQCHLQVCDIIPNRSYSMYQNTVCSEIIMSLANPENKILYIFDYKLTPTFTCKFRFLKKPTYKPTP